MAEEEAKGSETKRAGRGLAFIASAKIYFIVTAYAVHFLLPRLLGSPAVYGLFKQGMSAASILNNVLIAATVQTVSKMVSEHEELAPSTLRRGLQIQLVVGGVLAGTLFTTAPWIASGLMQDPAVTPLLRVAASVALAYAVYAALVGSLNGRRLFNRQAGLDAGFSTLRTAGVLGTAALGYGALGSMIGWAGAATGILLAALLVVGIGRGGAAPRSAPLGRWLRFMGPLWLFHAFLNGILLIDVLVLKGTLTSLGIEAGLRGEEAAHAADEYVGYYGAAQNFAFVPYQLMLSMTFIVFPMISRATSAGDTEAAQRTIRGALRFSFLVLISVAAPIAGASDGVMTLAYPDEYLAGSGALSILVFGAAAFALFVIAATVLSGAGRPSLSAVIGCIGLVAVVGMNLLLVRMVGIGEHTVVAAASGTTIGMGIAMLAGAWAVWRGFGAFLPPWTVVRGLAGGTVAWVVANQVPHRGAMAIAALAAGFLAFGAVLWILRELRADDVAATRRVLGR